MESLNQRIAESTITVVLRINTRPGKRWHKYRTSPFWIGKSTIFNGVCSIFFNSYLKLPEGIIYRKWENSPSRSFVISICLCTFSRWYSSIEMIFSLIRVQLFNNHFFLSMTMTRYRHAINQHFLRNFLPFSYHLPTFFSWHVPTTFVSTTTAQNRFRYRSSAS